MRGAAAPLVRYRGVGNNAVKAAFKAAGFRRESAEAAAAAMARGGLFAPGPPKKGRRQQPRPPPPPPAEEAASGESAPVAPPPFTALWGGQLSTEEYAALTPGLTVNHFPCANELGRKDRLAGALRAAAARSGADAFAFHPRTFCLPADGAAWASEAAAAAAAHAGAVAAGGGRDAGGWCCSRRNSGWRNSGWRCCNRPTRRLDRRSGGGGVWRRRFAPEFVREVELAPEFVREVEFALGYGGAGAARVALCRL
jgi:hypothetical protein